MRSFFREFKAFAIKGNVVDLAVAVIIGAAFGKIVSSLVNNVIMPTIGVLIGGVDFTTLTFMIGEAEITYGTFLQSIVDFIIIALVVFLGVKFIGEFRRKEEAKPEKEKTVEASEEVKLLREIRDAVQKK